MLSGRYLYSRAVRVVPLQAVARKVLHPGSCAGGASTLGLCGRCLNSGAVREVPLQAAVREVPLHWGCAGGASTPELSGRCNLVFLGKLWVPDPHAGHADPAPIKKGKSGGAYPHPYPLFSRFKTY